MPESPMPPPFLPGPHDHARCAAQAMATAEALCEERGARLTPLRRRVLELIWQSHVPIGAYDILRQLSADHAGAAPPTVYRALDFLLAQGLIHRLESANAFIGCADPGDPHAGQFLICTDCGVTAEMHDAHVTAAIHAGAARFGFTSTRKIVEVQGLCAGCRTAH